MKYPEMDWRRMEQVIDKVGGMEFIDIIISPETEFIMVQRQAKLEHPKRVTIPANDKKFVAKDAFLKEDGISSKDLVLIDQGFLQGMIDKVEEVQNSDQKIIYHLHTGEVRRPVDTVLAIGGWNLAEISLYQIFYLIEHQKAPDEGILSDRNWFFLKNTKKRPCSLRVYRHKSRNCEAVWALSVCDLEVTNSYVMSRDQIFLPDTSTVS